jgi:heme exporter protein D
MIPDLGKYAADVLSAYAIALILLIGLVAISLRQAARARTALQKVEEKTTRKTGKRRRK